MNIEEFDKTINELKEEIDYNNKKIDLCDERKRMANVNQLDYKLQSTLFFSVIPYMILLGIMGLSANLIGVAAFTSVIPSLSFPVIISLPSLMIGESLRKLMVKKFKAKERLKKFSKAKTQSEKLEEEIYYEIEQKKLENRNEVIEKCINSLDSNKLIINTLSHKYNVIEKEEILTIEEANKKFESLKEMLAKKYEELDILTTKSVLSNKFHTSRSNFERNGSFILSTLLGGILTLLIYIAPLFTILPAVHALSLFSVVSAIIGPFILGGVGVGTYTINKIKNNSKVFNSLNSKLGEQALPNKEKIEFDYNETFELIELISNKINETVSIKTAVIETKKKLENLLLENVNETEKCNISKKNDKSLNYEISNFNVNEDTFDKPKVKKIGQKTDKK